MQNARWSPPIALVWLMVCGLMGGPPDAGATPSLQEALASKRDLWGEAAIAQPNGPTFEFFEKLLPPPRYVNADFKYYPIVLSGPNTTVKARLISNGSGVNLRGGTSSWNDNGTAALFRVGPDQLLFGTFPARLQSEPKLAEGYLPIVELKYLHPTPFQTEGMVPLNQERIERESEVYRLEAFAPADKPLAENGVVMVEFSLTGGQTGLITVQMDSPADLKFESGRLLNPQGQVVAVFDKSWTWDRKRARARLNRETRATLAIITKPLAADSQLSMSPQNYDEYREQCAGHWHKILGEGMQVATPEEVVNNAWRQLTIQNFSLIHGDRMHYSQGNQYDKPYEAEGSDTAMAFLVWGFEQDTRRLMKPLFDFTRIGLEFHQAGFKLNDLCRYYWQTRDASIVKDFRSWPKPQSYQTSPKEQVSGWEIEARRLDTNRTGAHGLYPPEQYCGDIHTPVQTLNANSKSWRAMRDLGVVLQTVGEKDLGEHYADVAREYRKTILQAIEASADRKVQPPFVPIALYTNELAHDPICDVRIGSYWNIIIGYTIASGIFPAGSPEETWIPRYQEQHGGLCMGMLRAGGMSNSFWNTEFKVNPLYGTRYALDALRRDDPERALVCFYGMLAQGFTKNTFECGEGAALEPVDERGRLFYLPPNSAANAHFLSMLRYLLVQDLDLDDDGVPETLRLGFATPRGWMADGKGYEIARAPSAFGPITAKVESHLSTGEARAQLDLPGRNQPAKALFRLRLPAGYRVSACEVGGKSLQVDEKGTVDITALRGRQLLVFKTARN